MYLLILWREKDYKYLYTFIYIKKCVFAFHKDIAKDMLLIFEILTFQIPLVLYVLVDIYLAQRNLKMPFKNSYIKYVGMFLFAYKYIYSRFEIIPIFASGVTFTAC